MPTKTITPEELQIIIDQAQARYMVALLLLLGMVAIVFGALFLAIGFRKTGFVFIGVYGVLMSFIGVGLCYIFGPVIVLLTIGGFAREWLITPKKAA